MCWEFNSTWEASDQQQPQGLNNRLPTRLGTAHLKHLNVKHSSKDCLDIASRHQI